MVLNKIQKKLRTRNPNIIAEPTDRKTGWFKTEDYNDALVPDNNTSDGYDIGEADISRDSHEPIQRTRHNNKDRSSLPQPKTDSPDNEMADQEPVYSIRAIKPTQIKSGIEDRDRGIRR